MKYKSLIKIIFLLFIFIALQTPLLSQQVLKSGVFGNGGRAMSSTNYNVKGTLNQTAIGKLSSTNYTQFSGFWRGAYHITSIEDLLFDLPTSYQLYQNYPNPFNPSTVIKYDLPKSSNVKIFIYNILGQKVISLLEDFKPAGRYSVSFNASQLSSGVYFYTIQAEGFTKVKRMILAK